MSLPPEERVSLCRIATFCEPSAIGFVNAIIDSYEGVAVMRSPRPDSGKVVFWCLAAAKPAVLGILAELGRRLPLRVEEIDE